jgi:hypothetical protein
MMRGFSATCGHYIRSASNKVGLFKQFVTAYIALKFTASLASIYRNGPWLWGWGFWAGKTDQQICAFLNKGMSELDFIDLKTGLTTERCLEMINSDFIGFVYRVGSFVFLCAMFIFNAIVLICGGILLFVIVFWFLYNFCFEKTVMKLAKMAAVVKARIALIEKLGPEEAREHLDLVEPPASPLIEKNHRTLSLRRRRRGSSLSEVRSDPEPAFRIEEVK